MTAISNSVRQSIQIEDAPVPLGTYSHAVRAGNILFLSGQGCRDAATGIEAGVTTDDEGKVVAYDIEAQTRGCLKNMIKVLETAGLALPDLVDVTVFLSDMSDFPKYNKVWAEYFNFPDPPARTTVAVKALPGRNFIEMKAVAVFGKDRVTE